MPKQTKTKMPIAQVRAELERVNADNSQLFDAIKKRDTEHLDLMARHSALQDEFDALQREASKPERYISKPGEDKDYIDHTYDSMSFEQFVAAIQWTIGKYFSRFGKKDDIVKEAYKIRDYANRFYDKVVLESEKTSSTND